VTPFARHLAGLIRADGPLRLDRFMALANTHYYATRDPLGAGGDFTTAPEISQLFGEMLGLALLDHWERSGAPARFHLVELGPGRGTLMADILRAAKLRPAFLAAAELTLVETSPTLRARQAATLADHAPSWADSFAALPIDAPLYLVANEFFDALPIRQFVMGAAGWHERFVSLHETGAFAFALGPPTSLRLPEEPRSGVSKDVPSILEINEPARAIAAEIGAALNARGGLALIVDYGHARTALGDTLQAVQAHRFADPLATPGEADLTAHVDFQALAEASSATPYGPVTQGALLAALGIEARARALIRARPDQNAAISAALTRLVDPGGMGTLFKAMALTGPGGPHPAGFAA
jgi:SAM-dependent MidA family methyltransferase